MRALIIFLMLFVGSLHAEDQGVPVRAELIAGYSSVVPGETLPCAIRLKIDPQWHLYWKNAGEVGFPITVKWKLPSGLKAGEMQWPYPRVEKGDMGVHYTYRDEVWLLVPIIASDNLQVGQSQKIEATVQWLACSESGCVPGEKQLTVEVPVKRDSPKVSDPFSWQHDLIPQKKTQLTVGRNGDRITVDIADLPFPLSQVDFCPESGTIEQLNWSSSSKQLTFSWKDSPSSPLLKGVFIFEGIGKKAAWEIEAPMVDSAQEVALADELGAPSLATEPLSLFWVAGFALLGGLILNFMPCVLPVVSLKIMSLMQMAGEKRSETLKHGGVFALGVLVSFWVLAGLLLILQSYGRAVGWGFQLQEPLFVAALAALVFLFGLSLFGVFEIGLGIASWAGQKEVGAKASGKLLGSFLSGVLATAVATPCTGPFLGSAIGVAVTLPALSSLLIFSCVGIGMASPYILIAFFPSLLRYLPKPGNWMITFKELLGFVMVATALWLMWVFAAQTGTPALFQCLAGLFIIGVACWIYGKWGAPTKSRTIRKIAKTAALFTLIGSAYIIYGAAKALPPPANEIAFAEDTVSISSWEPFSTSRLVQLRRENRPVIVDFTARWCLICQSNHLVLSVPEVEKRLNELGVVRMEADWTSRDPEITEVLKAFGRSGVPLYLLYGPDPEKPPAVMPQVLTPEIVIDYLNQMEKDG